MQLAEIQHDTNATEAAKSSRNCMKEALTGYAPSLRRVTEIAEAACARIPPLWGLDSFVAVNPFWGMRQRRFGTALSELASLTNESALPGRAYFQAKLRNAEITKEEIEQARRNLQARHPALVGMTVDEILSELEAGDVKSNESPTSLLQLLDRKVGENYSELTHTELTKFLALYFDKGQAAIPSTLSQLPLFDAWLEFSSTDLSLTLEGIPNSATFFARFREGGSLQASLPEYAETFSEDDQTLELLFSTELFSIRGWAAYLQHLDFEDAKLGKTCDRVRTLLAIRCAYTLLAAHDCKSRLGVDEIGSWLRARAERQSDREWVTLLTCQHALELRFRSQLGSAFLPVASATQENRPRLQAMFCIDVRSEGFRRSLEAVSPEIETYGFAGFFGLSFGFSESGANAPSEQYPVLLQRKFSVTEATDLEHPTELPGRDRARHALSLFVRILRQSVCSGFSYVESLGVFYGAKMLKQTAASERPRSPRGVASARTQLIINLTLDEKIAAAQGILKNSGLRQPLAPIVLLCGHRGCVTNNPYAAGLDCGACGGHGGESNARVAAELLNDPMVRSGLNDRGVAIPGDTRFVPAVHITTTEEIELLDAPEGSELRNWLDLASSRSRTQLALSLGGIDLRNRLAPQMAKRSADWSELRPEWALARNAGFIAARRARTRGVDLSNRCFLHEYDSSKDVDSSILELIMTAPMVVASWINLQYYGSTVMPETFGSGNKIIHNVVGQLGTVLGNGGDLGIGLPLQSVHTGDAPFHEPLRLQVMLEAPVDKIDAVIAKHNLLQELIDNEWIALSALSPVGSSVVTRVAHGEWR
jgi:uncharacterized protein YbcC (UPF0753/DUF2309 family)